MNTELQNTRVFAYWNDKGTLCSKTFTKVCNIRKEGNLNFITNSGNANVSSDNGGFFICSEDKLNYMQ